MVQILMSTYNGEQYIREQLDSILNQSYQDIQIQIRDDGSSDGTIAILKEYSGKYGNIQYYVGENVGACASFFELFNYREYNADYYATCDQDDVWMEDKIAVAVKRLENNDRVALYCCRTQLVDEHLRPLEDHLRNYCPRPSFGNAMIENICTGCTIVFNKKLYQMIKGKRPQHCVIHDMWLYQVASCFGAVIYDEQPHIYYRQHSGNVIGLDQGRIGLIKRQIQSLKRFRGKYTAQMREFCQMFELDGENRKLANIVVSTQTSWNARVDALRERKIYRQGKFDNILFKLMLFCGIL